MQKLNVVFDETEYEVSIKTVLCDFCSETFEEDEMHFIQDVAVCEACYDNMN